MRRRAGITPRLKSLVALGILPAFATLLVLVGFSCTALAQTETGSITGTVTDQTGAVIVGANVTIKNIDTKLERQATTSASGNYTVPSLPPGVYEVRVEAAGFAKSLQKAQVTVGSRVSLDSVLAVGGEENVVEVTAGESGIQVNTVSQDLTTVVNQKQLVELPTLTRNPYALVAISGNVSPGDLGDPNGAASRGVGVSINGSRAASTNILLDGSDNNNTFTATTGQNVPLDSVQEFSVITNNFSAEYGRASGGIVNVATKSGSNELHGSLYEFNRVAALASNDFDNNAQYKRIEKGIFTRNQFGYSIGGPVRKDKMFFFSSGEFIRVRSVGNLTFVVPTPEFINASSAATKDFFNGAQLVSPINGRLFTRGQVAALIGSKADGPFAKLPSGLPVLGELTVPIPVDQGGGDPQNRYEFVNRFDWNISNKTTLYARYALESLDNFPGVVSRSPYKGFNTTNEDFNNNILLSVTHVFSPRFTSVSKIVFNRLNNQQPLGDSPVTPTLFTTGSTSVPRLPGSFQVVFPGYLPTSPGNGIPFGGPQNLTQVFEDVNFGLGKHELRFGGQYVHIQDNRAFGAYEEAVEILGSNLAGAFDNFVRGQLLQFQAAIDPQGKFPLDTVKLPVGPPSFNRSNRYNDFALYANDQYRVHPRVTLNLGVRYEYYGVQHNKDPKLDSNFYLGPGANFFEKIRNGNVFLAPDSPKGGLWGKDINNFAPRLGIAWDIFGNGKTSLRGGFGVSYERNFGNVTFNVIQNPPNYAVISINPSDVGGVIPISRNNAGPLAGSTGSKVLPRTSLRNVDDNITTAYNYLYSASLEHQLFKNVVFSLEYSGSKGIDLYSIENPNRLGSGQRFLGDANTNGNPGLRLNKQYTNINRRGTNGFSRYDAMTIGVQSGNLGDIGLLFTARYTWSHAIDNLSSTFSEASNNFNLGLLDPFNPRLDKGNADFDIRHRFVTSGVWEIPFAKNTKGLKRQLLHGYGISYIFDANTGTPFTIFDCTNGVTVCNRLLLVAQQRMTGLDNLVATAPDAPNSFRFIDLSGQAAGVGTYADLVGTAENGPYPQNMVGRNTFRGPGRWNMNAIVTKKFIIKERYSLQLRAEAYNLFNHANLFITTSNADVSSFDFIEARRFGRRNVQLAIKFAF